MLKLEGQHQKRLKEKTTLIKGEPSENCPKLIPGLKNLSKVKKEIGRAHLYHPPSF